MNVYLAQCPVCGTKHQVINNTSATITMLQQLMEEGNVKEKCGKCK